jgi:hypothetical protein
MMDFANSLPNGRCMKMPDLDAAFSTCRAAVEVLVEAADACNVVPELWAEVIIIPKQQDPGIDTCVLAMDGQTHIC